MSQVFKIAGMSCAHCAIAVSEALESIPGIENVNVDLGKGTAMVEGAGFTFDQIREAVSEEGYEAAIQEA